MNNNPGHELAAEHNREIPTPSRHLSADQFGGDTTIGAWSADRTGGLGSTSMSEAAGHVEDAGRKAQQLIKEGNV